MSYWDNLCISRSVSDILKFDHLEDSGVFGVLLKKSGYFLAEMEGQIHQDGSLKPFHSSVAPMESAWEVYVNGMEFSRNIGRFGMEWMRADGHRYTETMPYVSRPHFFCPSNLVFYDNLPVWGSRIERYASEFMPSKVWIGKLRYARIFFSPDLSRSNADDSAEMIIDLLHKMAIYYKVENSFGVAVEMSVSKARYISEPQNKVIEEVYAAGLS